MASRAATYARFRSGCSVANSLATDNKAGGDTASGAVGSVFPASLLRTSFVLPGRSHVPGQCVYAERIETDRTAEHDVYGYVDHSDDVLKE